MINKYQKKFTFEIKDHNSEDKEYYKYIYERINNAYENLEHKHRQL